MWFIIYVLFFLAAAWLFAFMFLRGSSMKAFDEPIPQDSSTVPSAEHDWVLERLSEIRRAVNEQDNGHLLQRARAAVDLMGQDTDLSEFTITAVDSTVEDGPLRGEWVVHTHSAADRRLLYIHGGAFVVGSPRSHRSITTRLARDLKVSVFAVDYRMMPEHRRMLGVQDCQNAYAWLQNHGPAGAGPATKLVIAGDSAGGNLTLAMIAWASRAGVMTPAAAVALCPLTDSTFDSPTWRSNKATDHMLGPSLGRLHALPRSLLLYLTWITNRVLPSDPRVSPLRGDLSGLPPTLVHASQAEMLLGDAVRYVNRARAAGSEAQLQTWPHVIHVWHLFQPRLPEANQAFEAIQAFLTPHLETA